MALSTTDLSDTHLERWLRAPALFFRLELADTIVYKTTTAFVDFIYLSISSRANIYK